MFIEYLKKSKQQFKLEDSDNLSRIFSDEFGDNYLPYGDIRQFHPLKVGGPIDHLVIANNSRQLFRAFQIACQNQLNRVVLGLGHSTLVHDRGFGALVIINRSCDI